MGASNEWKGAIKPNVISKTTGSVWSKPGSDFIQHDFCLSCKYRELSGGDGCYALPILSTLGLANYLSSLD